MSSGLALTGTGWSVTGVAVSATNLAGGAANQIPVQTGASATSFIVAPSVSNTFLKWNGAAFVWASSAEASDITVGTTTVTGGTTTRVLYDSAGVLGEYAVSGTGSVAMTASPVFTGTPTLPTPFTLGAVSVTATGTQLNYLASAAGTTGTTSTNLVFSTSPTLVTPVLGVATGTSLALGGATIGSNALAVTGSAAVSTSLTVGTTIMVGGDSYFGGTVSNASLYVNSGANTVNMTSGGILGFTAGGNPTTGADAIIKRRAPANLQLGASDAAAPVAQTLAVQSVVAGTSNTAGVDWTQTASVGTGTGVGGDYVVQVAPAGSTGTAQNSLVDALRIKGTKSVVLGSAALATNATDGFLYVASGAGTPTGTPTAFTGRVAMYVDTTNSQLWFYLGGAWKQPKTPAAAATVTWQ